MIYVKQTFEYLKKAFPMLVVAAVLPAITMGIFCSPFSVLTFIPTYIKSRSGGYADVLWMLFSRRGFLHVYPYILISVAMVFSLSYSLSIMEKHFKTGKLRLHNPVRFINNSMLSVLKVLPLAVGIVFLLLLLQSGAVSIIRFVATGPNAHPTVVDIVLTSTISVLMYLVQIAIIVFMGVWVVIIQIFGFSFQDAFVEAVRVVSKKWLSFIGGLVVPITMLLIPVAGLKIFDGLAAARIFANIAIYTLIIVYCCAYIMVSVYSITGLERRDQKSVVPTENKYTN